MDFRTDSRFVGIRLFESKLWLVSPTMHDDAQKWVEILEYSSRRGIKVWHGSVPSRH